MIFRFLSYCLIACPVNSWADIGEWMTFTNKNDIRDIGVYGNSVWCATNGGVFKFNFEDSSYEEITNTNGLDNNDVKTLEIDPYGNVWFGLTNGYINIYRQNERRWESIDDYFGQTINDLKFYGDSVFVALNIGVSLYNIARQEVKETYKNLGSGFQVEVPVKNIFLNGRDIWVGTDFGIAKSNLNIVNLLAPESWINYTPSNSNLLSKKIRAISLLNGTIFVATDQGVNQFDGTTWSSANEGLNSVEQRDVYALSLIDNTLYAGTAIGVFKFFDNRWNLLGETIRNITCMASAENGDIWIGKSKTSASEGFSQYHLSAGNWEHLVPPGPAGNNFKDLAVDLNGVLWGCSTTDGIFRFDGKDWKNYNKKNYNFKNDDFWAVKVDRFNQKWFASWGGGVVKIDANENVTIYDHRYLSGINIDITYVPVTNVAIDDNDNVWFTIYGAADGNVVAVTTQDGRWQYFSTSEGIIVNAAKELYGITADRYNRIWVGSRSGITVIDFNNTLFNKSDDDLNGTLTTNDGLVSNDVRSLAEDLDGIMWLGTDQGLNYWLSGDIYTKSGVIHDNLQSIAVDVRNNKWFGTIAGVSVLGADNYTWTHYTTENSPLVGSNVTAIAFDEVSGKVYIGTTSGLSCLETPYAKAQINLDNVTAGPNPFLLKEGEKFTIYKLADEVSIRFLTTDGMLLRNIPKDDIQGFYEWDGRNDDGEYLASGVYLYLIFNEKTGLSKVGKVAIIKE